MPKFRDIPRFTRDGKYRSDTSWDYFINDWVPKHIEELNFDMDPDFQRSHVWVESQQIRYCEFILRGGKSARDIYINHPGWMTDWNGDMVLVDGKQRIEAVRRFLHNEIKVFGHYFNEYEDRLPLLDASFSVNVNDLQTRAEVLQWYLDINAGGVVHTNEEIEKVRRLLENEKK